MDELLHERIACVRSPSRAVALLSAAAEGREGDVVEAATNATTVDLDPELILFSPHHATVRLRSASVACGVERRPLAPLYPLPREGPPLRVDTFHTPIEGLRPGERVVFELVFLRGGSCDVSVFCRLAGP